MDSHTLLAILIISLAFGSEAVFGFGGGLIAIPLLSLFMDIRDAVTLALIFQVGMGLLVFKVYRHIQWKVALPISGGLVVGGIIGTLLLSRANTTFLQLFLAGSLLLFLVKMIFFKDLAIRRVDSRAATVGTGVVGGLFQGLIGTGGPVLAMYLTVAVRDKARFRATLIYLLFLVCVVRLLISIPERLITPDILEQSLWIAPFFVVAITIGQFLNNKIQQGYYQMAIYIILLVSAGSLLFKAFTH